MTIDQRVPLDTRQACLDTKLNLLSHGLRLSPVAVEAYGPPYLEKRRAYGNADPFQVRALRLPQELYILPEHLIVAANIKFDSPCVLDFDGTGFFVTRPGSEPVRVTFPRRPRFYDAPMPDGKTVKQFITLYGGGSLGIFVNGSCSLPDMNAGCQFCSIQQNRAIEDDFAHVITPARLREALNLALQDLEAPVLQVMINGGNFRDRDKSFSYYAELTAIAREVINESGRPVDLHLIVFPPKDLGLLSLLQDLNVKVAMNTEVFDSLLFNKYCPGKVIVAGQAHILLALERAASVLGFGRVYSIFAGGLEPEDSLAQGLAYLAERNVIPVINVLHTDPGTPLEHFPNPSVETAWRMGELLQGTYRRLGRFVPFYENCGRNSIDTEAHRGFFETYGTR